MKRSEKVLEVENLTLKIKEAKAVALADYKGLNTSQANQLRDKVRAAGGELQVVKNSLFERALRQNNYKIKRDEITGTSLALFSHADEIAPLKILAAMGKTLNLLPLKIGFMAGQILTAEELNRFASLPGKKELQAKLVGLLAGQPSRLVRALNWNIQRLVLALNEVKNKKH